MCKIMRWVRRNRVCFQVIRRGLPFLSRCHQGHQGHWRLCVYLWLSSPSNKHFIVYSLFWSPCTPGLELVSVWGRNKALEPKLCRLGLNILEDGLEIGKLSEYWKMKSLEHYPTLSFRLFIQLHFLILGTPLRLSLSLIFPAFWLISAKLRSFKGPFIYYVLLVGGRGG